MSLPANFSTNFGEEADTYFRHVCVEFKRIVKETKNIDDLQEVMERFIGASKQNKEAIQQALSKVWSAFKKYVYALMENAEEANAGYLLGALTEAEALIS